MEALDRIEPLRVFFSQVLLPFLALVLERVNAWLSLVGRVHISPARYTADL